MKLIKNITPKKRLEYRHYIIFNRKKYIREEAVIPQSYCWESTPDKLEDTHTIKWTKFGDKNEDIIEYYSCNHGWSKDNKMDKSNPVPEIEKVFKETIGKDLIYF